MSTGKQGGNTSSVEYSPAVLGRIKRARTRQEERWAAKASPVQASTMATLPMDVECPVCSAAPGQKCKSRQGRALHRDRVKKALG